MSEFECACGNLIPPSVGRCELCGGRAVRMDGMGNRELAAQEREQEALQHSWAASEERKEALGPPLLCPKCEEHMIYWQTDFRPFSYKCLGCGYIKVEEALEENYGVMQEEENNE